MNPDHIILDVMIQFGHDDVYRHAIKLDRTNEGLSPLPGDRELPFAFRSRERAEQQIRHRRATCETIGNEIAEALLKAIGERDPINGYSREERKQFNEP